MFISAQKTVKIGFYLNISHLNSFGDLMSKKIDDIIANIPQYAAEFVCKKEYSLMKGELLIKVGEKGVVYWDAATIYIYGMGQCLFQPSCWNFLGYVKIPSGKNFEAEE